MIVGGTCSSLYAHMIKDACLAINRGDKPRLDEIKRLSADEGEVAEIQENIAIKSNCLACSGRRLVVIDSGIDLENSQPCGIKILGLLKIATAKASAAVGSAIKGRAVPLLVSCKTGINPGAVVKGHDKLIKPVICCTSSIQGSIGNSIGGFPGFINGKIICLPTRLL